MALYAAFAGYRVTALHDPAELTQVPVVLRFPPEYRSQLADLSHIVLPTPVGPTPLSALSQIEEAQCQRAGVPQGLAPDQLCLWRDGAALQRVCGARAHGAAGSG